MKRDISDKRNELRNKSIALDGLKLDKNLKYETAIKIAGEQNEVYKKWEFYDNFIKANEKIKK